MGGNVADYRVVQDTSFQLSAAAGQDRDRTFGPFSLPGDTIVSQESILSFNVAGDARLNITINGNNVADMRLGSADAFRCIQEACSRNILRAGEGNSITFDVRDGSCSISDVVLWFQNAT